MARQERRISPATGCRDGGSEPVIFEFRSVPAVAQPVGAVALAPLAPEGITRRIRTALVAAPASGLLRLGGDTAGILAGSAAAGALRPIEGGIIVPQSDRVWLLTRDRDMAKVDLATLVPAAAEPIALSLPAGGIATLPAVPASSTAPAWETTRFAVVSTISDG
jgi:hypothetical protein